MATEYEKKLADKLAKKLTRNALNEWCKYGNASINDILERKGFRQSYGSSYKYEQTIWNGARFKITLDVYDLIIGHGNKIAYEVNEF